MDGPRLLLYSFLVLLLNSIFVALVRHPGEDPSFWARLLRAVGRASFLQHGAAELLASVLHVPFTAQKVPLDELVPLDRDLAGEPTVKTSSPPGSRAGTLALALLPCLVLCACFSYAAHKQRVETLIDQSLTLCEAVPAKCKAAARCSAAATQALDALHAADKLHVRALQQAGGLDAGPLPDGGTVPAGDEDTARAAAVQAEAAALATCAKEGIR